jgi:hypothetical protein
MNLEDVEAFTVEANIGSDKARKSSDGRYISCPLPDEVGDLGFEVGDRVSLKLVREHREDVDTYFIRCSTEDIGRHSLQIRVNEENNPELFIRIPIEYTFYREGQSFHGLDKNDRLTVEVNYGDGEFRIYTADDFRFRLKELSEDGLPPTVKTPVFAPLLTESSDGFVDLSEGVDGVEGQRFEIVAFDGQDDLFVQIAEEEKQKLRREEGSSSPRFSAPVGDDNPRSTFYGSQDLLKHALENHELPVLEADSIEIFWKFESVGSDSLQKMGRIFEAEDAKSVKVILPKLGSFLLKVTHGESSTSLKLLSNSNSGGSAFRGGWSTKFWSDPEDSDVPSLYLPVPQSGRGWWDYSSMVESSQYVPE